ncbi:MAG: patatin-like phospholipase family protein [Steroidobacteraceae bacterium]
MSRFVLEQQHTLPCFHLVKRAHRALLSAGLLLLSALHPVLAQEAAPTRQDPAIAATRPRVGLVLSGGGARGAAHIGVLKVLDALHVPVDAIAGTSMGALVGGLYASGMTPAEIETLVNSLDWQDAFRDRPPRTTLGFRRKQDDRNFLVRYSLGVSMEGFELPTGLVQGQKQTQLLRGATLPVAGTTDFDKLPTPFRAIATDLESGKEVVMSSGDLVTAMRASMSAPGVFTPEEVNGRLLVDGGLVNNLPTEIARAMNVDVLIVVDVSFPLSSADELTSPLAVTNQAVAIMVRNRTLEKRAALQPSDIVIDPELGTMSSADFARVGRALAAGESAAQAASEQLKTLSMSEAAYWQYQAARLPKSLQTPRINFVQTDVESARYAEAVDAVMEDLKGQPLDRVRVNDDLASLYALDLFESIDYSLVNRNQQSGLEFHLKPKSWGPNYVRVGINLEDDFAGNSRYNLASRLIMTDLNNLGAEWLTDVQIGDRPRFATEYYQPLSWRQRYFVAPRLEYGVRSLPLLSDDDKELAEYRVRNALASVDMGRELANWGEMRVGVQRGFGSSRVLIGDPNLPIERYNTGGYFARFSYDTLDNVFFPRRGAQVTLQWNAERAALGADRSSDKVSVEWQMAKTFDRYTMILSTDIGSNLTDDPATHDYFTLGGFLNLSGVTTGSLSGPHYGIARLIYYKQVGRGGSGVLQLPAYAGISIEAGNTWQRRSDASFANLRHDGSLFFGADTPLGPLYLAAGVDDRRKTAFYLFLGRSF